MPNTIFDIDAIAPLDKANPLPPAERRLQIAIDSAAAGRNTQARIIKLIEATESSDLKTLSHNTRMKLLSGLRPADPDAEPGHDAMLARMKVYSTLELPEAFIDQSRDLGTRIARHFFSKQGEALDKAWGGKSDDDRLDTVIELLHAYGHESGFIPPGRIENESVPPDANNRILGAQYDANADNIWLNSHETAGWNDPVEVLATSAHEATHKLQRDMATLLVVEQRPDLAGQEPADKALFQTNDERIAAWYFFDNLRFGHIGSDVHEIGYKFQPLEQHARLVEQAVKQTLNRNLVLGLEDGLITGVTADDLSALGIDPENIRGDAPKSAPGVPRRDQSLPNRRFG